MKKGNLVVKTNQLNSALQNLSLSEIRIIQLAIVDARETNTGLSTNKPLRIDALRYADIFNTSRQNAYARMKDAEETLFNRRFSYINNQGKVVKSRWIQDVVYLDEEGAIELVFTRSVVSGISRIDGAENFFTSYLLEQTANLDSTYAVRLYELLIQWKAAKNTPLFKLNVFKEQLGLAPNEYKRMSNFKSRVLKVALQEIAEKTDIIASYEQVKEGRRIIGFKFKVVVKKLEKTVKENSQTLVDHQMYTIDGLSDQQLKRITRHKEFINTYNSLALGDAAKNWNAFTDFMIDLIKTDPTRFNKKRPIREYLNGTDDDYEYGF